MLTWIKEHAPPHHPDVAAMRSRSAGHAAGACLLGLLLGVTATALGVLVSWWLVLPYLLIMVWLLLPAGQVAEWTRAWAKPPNVASVSAPQQEPGAPPVPPETQTLPESSAAATTTTTEAVVTKPRRRRAPRRPRIPVEAAAPAAATWVQVGPGRFVRVEVSEPPAGAPVAESSEFETTLDLPPDASPSQDDSPAPIEAQPVIAADSIEDQYDEPAGPNPDEVAPAETSHVEESVASEEPIDEDDADESGTW